MSDEESGPGAVGYKRPPKATQFKPGQSGNPKGRPKRAKNFATAIEAELNARVTTMENGKKRIMTKRQAIATRLVNKAASGDPRALPILLNEAHAIEAQQETGVELAALSRPEDALVMANIVNRIRAAVPVPEADAAPGNSVGTAGTRRIRNLRKAP
jgi:hypothetical protein